MNKKQKKKLKEIIKNGKWNYVFLRGVVYFGGLMFFLNILWDKFILERTVDNFIIISYFIIFGIGGLVWGLWTWKSINEKVNEK